MERGSERVKKRGRERERGEGKEGGRETRANPSPEAVIPKGRKTLPRRGVVSEIRTSAVG